MTDQLFTPAEETDPRSPAAFISWVHSTDTELDGEPVSWILRDLIGIMTAYGPEDDDPAYWATHSDSEWAYGVRARFLEIVYCYANETGLPYTWPIQEDFDALLAAFLEDDDY